MLRTQPKLIESMCGRISNEILSDTVETLPDNGTYWLNWERREYEREKLKWQVYVRFFI